MNDDMSLGEKIIDVCACIISVFIGLLVIWTVMDTIGLDTASNYNTYSERETNPELILQQRYARGEIGNIEYLERMTRL